MDYFSLSHDMGWNMQDLQKRILDDMPSLQQITFEVSWDPRQTSSVLLHHERLSIVNELQHIVLKDETLWDGWVIDVEVKDATRWKIEWSGVIVLRRSCMLHGGDAGL